MSEEPQSRNAGRSGSPWAFSVGTMLGVPIRIHATFVLLLIWIGTISAREDDGFLTGVVFLLTGEDADKYGSLLHTPEPRRFQLSWLGGPDSVGLGLSGAPNEKW